MTRVLRLTLLAPDIARYRRGDPGRKQGPEVTLARVLEPFPVEWDEQRQPIFSTRSIA